MQSWLALRLIGWVMSRIRSGDIRPTLALDAKDVVLNFPGQNSFAGVYRGREEHKTWLERFVRCGFQIWADDVSASGPPWRMRIVIRGHDSLTSPEGELVYENRYVMWTVARWGRVKEIEVYEDTEKAAALDSWLEHNEQRLADARA